MTSDEAKQALKDGNKIMRRYWYEGDYIEETLQKKPVSYPFAVGDRKFEIITDTQWEIVE